MDSLTRELPAAVSSAPPSVRRGRSSRLPLGALLAAVAVFGLAWAYLLPPFQAPDEQAHLNYVQTLVEAGQLPGQPGQPWYSTEFSAAFEASGAGRTAARAGIKPEWSAASEEAWEAANPFGDAQRSDGTGPNPAASNPPLYYLLETPAYAIASSGDIFLRLQAMRIVSVAWLVVTALAAWLLAGEVFGRRPLLQLPVAAATALLPMVTFVSASVSPDAMLYAVWTLFLWLGVRTLRRGLTVRRAVALGLLVSAAVLVKATSYALLPPLALVALLGARRLHAAAGGRRVLVALASCAGALVVVLGAWFVVARSQDRAAAAQVSATATASGLNLRQFLSYVWQYYLPALPFMTDPAVGGAPPWGLRDVWVHQSIGSFGWLEIRWPWHVYRVGNWVTAALAVGVVAALVARRRSVDLRVLAFLALTVACLVGGLHWSDFRLLTAGLPFNQGRYLFPVMAVFALGLGQLIALLHGRARVVASGAVLACLAFAQLAALGLIALRFHVVG